MKIEQTLTLDEKILDVIVRQYISSRGIRTKLVFLNVLAALIAALGVVFLIDADYLAGGIVLAIALFLFIFATFYYKRLLQKNLKKVNEANLGTSVTETVDEEIIRVRSELGTNEYKWSAVESVKRMDDLVGITLKNRAIVIFRSELLSSGEIDWLLSKNPTEGEKKNG